MIPTRKLSRLERALLRSVVELGDDAYGVPLRKAAEASTERFLAIGTLYAAMNRLEKEGFVRSFDVQTDRVRRYWRPCFDLMEILREEEKGGSA